MRELHYAFIIAFLTSSVASSQEASHTMLQAIGTAHKANQASQTRGLIRFEYRQGNAESAEDVLAGRTRPRPTGIGLHVLDLPRARHEVMYPPKAFAGSQRRVDQSRFTSVLAPTRCLTDGNLTLIDRLGLSPDGLAFDHRVVINPGVMPFYGQVVTPLSLGRPTPGLFTLGKVLDQVTDPAAGVLANKIVEDSVEGVPVKRMEFSWKGGQAAFWVDLNRGAIPLRSVFVDTATGEETILLNRDIRNSANGSWYPFHQVYYMGNPKLYKETVVTDANFDQPPDPGYFRLEFDQPVAAENHVAGVVYPAAKSWDLSALPARGDMIVTEAPGEPPAMPSQSEEGAWWPWILIAAICMAAIGGGWAFYRMRRD